MFDRTKIRTDFFEEQGTLAVFRHNQLRSIRRCGNSVNVQVVTTVRLNSRAGRAVVEGVDIKFCRSLAAHR